MATLIMSELSFLVSPSLQLSFDRVTPLEDFKSEAQIGDFHRILGRIQDKSTARSNWFEFGSKLSKEVPEENFGHVSIDDTNLWCDVALLVPDQSMRDLMSAIQICGANTSEICAGVVLTDFFDVANGKRGALCVSVPTITVQSFGSQSVSQHGNA